MDSFGNRQPSFFGFFETLETFLYRYKRIIKLSTYLTLEQLECKAGVIAPALQPRLTLETRIKVFNFLTLEAITRVVCGRYWRERKKAPPFRVVLLAGRGVLPPLRCVTLCDGVGRDNVSSSLLCGGGEPSIMYGGHLDTLPLFLRESATHCSPCTVVNRRFTVNVRQGAVFASLCDKVASENYSEALPLLTVRADTGCTVLYC